MAIYAAKLVYDQTKAKCERWTYFGRLKNFDHVFCIVRLPPPSDEVLTIKKFKDEPGFSQWVVVDPWLNVCCAANDYPGKVEERLTAWSLSGKRILLEDECYLPNGTYKVRLMNSQVEFRKYA